jgi:hypothetical protein
MRVGIAIKNSIMNSKEQTEKQDISQLWTGFSDSEEVETRDANSQQSNSIDRGEETPMSESVLYEPFSSFSLLPPFAGASGPRISHSRIGNFVSFLSSADRLTGNINMLLTGGHFENVVYLTALGNLNLGYFASGSGYFNHEYEFLDPATRELSLNARLIAEFPHHAEDSLVYQLSNFPHHPGSFAVLGKVTLGVQAYTSDNRVTSRAASTNFLSIGNSPETTQQFYQTNPEMKITVPLLEHTVRLRFHMRFDMKCLVPENYSNQAGLSGTHYSMIDMRDPLYPLDGCVLPDYYLPCSNKPAPGSIRVKRIDCDFSEVYYHENDHRTD